MSYTIERTDELVLIRGPVVLYEMVGLMRVYRREGFTHLDGKKAEELGATFCFVKRPNEDGKKEGKK